MKMKKTKTILLYFACLIGVAIQTSSNAKAKPLPSNGHYYAMQRLHRSDITGGAFATDYAANYFTSNWNTYSNINSFIDNEMWITFPNGSWLETGYTVGKMQERYVSFWEGSFVAYSYSDIGVYYEFPIGNSRPVGPTNYLILNTGNNQFTTYLNGVAQYTMNTQYNTASRMDVGLETSDTGNTFQSGIYNRKLQYQSKAGGWSYWSSKDYIEDCDVSDSTLGWNSTLKLKESFMNQNDAQIFFTHK